MVIRNLPIKKGKMHRYGAAEQGGLEIWLSGIRGPQTILQDANTRINAIFSYIKSIAISNSNPHPVGQY